MITIREIEKMKEEAYTRGQDFGYRNEWVQPSSLGYENEIADAFRDGFEDGLAYFEQKSAFEANKD